jgi:hypothetical protein
MRNKLGIWFSLVLLAAVSESSGGVLNTQVKFSLSDLSFRVEKGYTRISFKDDDLHIEELGKPFLPAKLVYHIIPPNAEVTKVRAISKSRIVLEDQYDIIPTQTPKSIKDEFEWVEPDQETYASSKPYPNELVKYTGSGYLAGYKIASFLIYPLQYSPLNKELILHTKVEISIEYSRSVNTSIPVVRKSNKNQELFRNMVKGMVLNPYDVDLYEPITQTVETSVIDDIFITDMPSSQGTPVEYLIITSDNLADEFQVLADWKTMRGVPATVRTTSWIQANYPNGADLQETIRKFIQDAYTNWSTVWVLIGGDVDIVPVRYAHIKYGAFHGENIPTDLYYSCLDGNWNDDGDAVFGEAFYDSVDLYPEVFVGRLPVGDSTQVINFLNKLFTYVNPDSTGYQIKALFIGADMYAPGDGGVICDTIANHFPSSFTKAKLYEQGRPPSRKEIVLDSLRTGFGIVVFEGHGGEVRINVKRAMPSEYLTRNDVYSLKNFEELSILYAVTCNSAAIDHEDSFCEHFIHNREGSGIAVVSASRYNFPGPDEKFTKTFFDSLFDGNRYKIGEVHSLSKIPFIGSSEYPGPNRYIQFSHILLGDPEMDIWINSPKCMTASFPDSVPLGSNQFTVTVQTCIPMSSISGALVTLKKSDEDYGYGLTDGSGQITFNFTPETIGSLSVVVTKHNYLPIEGYSDVYVPEPYVVYNNHFIDDDDTGGSSGNNNGIIDAGETIEMPLFVKNTGSGTAYSVNAKLTTSDSYVTITDSIETYGNIPSGDSVVSLEDFDFIVDTSAHDEHDLTFTVSMTYFGSDQPQADTLESTDEFTSIIRAPKLEHFAHLVADTLCPSCDGDGVPEVNEQFEFPVTLRNLWGGDAEEVTGALTTNNSGVIIITDSVYFGTIYGNSDAAPVGQNFYIKLQSSVPVPIDLELTIEDSYNRTWVDTFDIYYIPGSPTGLSSLPGRTSIDLSWEPNTESDILGYNVYNVLAGFVKLNSSIIEGVSYYQDTGLSQATDYTYLITAIDLDRNESKLPDFPSTAPTDATNPLDQWNWPIRLKGGELISSSVVTRIQTTQGKVVIQGAFNGEMYVLNSSGALSSGWPVHLNGSRFFASPAVGNIDFDSDLEIIVGSWSTDNKVYAWNPDGSLVCPACPPTLGSGYPIAPGWPRSVEGDTTAISPGSQGVFASAALGDLDGDGDLEVVVAAMKGKVYAWHGDGSGFWDSDPDSSYVQRSATSWQLSSPALGRVDTIPGVDIVVGSHDINNSVYAWHADRTMILGFPVNLGSGVASSPALGDIDPANDSLEIVVITTSGDLFVIHSDGSIADGWPQTVNLYASAKWNSPVLGDIDGDGSLEIVIGADDSIYAFEANGSHVSGWPAFRQKTSNSSPSIGDIDGDSDMEILIGSSDDQLYAYHHDGKKVKGFPIKTGYHLEASPTIQDFDEDGNVEVVQASKDEKLYVWDLPGSYSHSNIEWGKFRHDLWNTGNYDIQVTELPPPPRESSEGSQSEMSENMPKVYALRQNIPNPFGRETVIQYQLPKKSNVELKIYNIIGQQIQTLVNKSQKPGFYRIEWNGMNKNGDDVSSGIYFYRLNTGDFVKTRKMILLK